MIPKGIIIVLFGTYLMTIGAVLVILLAARRWISELPDASNRLIKAIWIICVAITVVFGGLATGVITLMTLRHVGFF